MVLTPLAFTVLPILNGDLGCPPLVVQTIAGGDTIAECSASKERAVQFMPCETPAVGICVPTPQLETH